MSRVLRIGSIAASAIAVAVLTGCATVPDDVDDTFDRIAGGGVLRVGITANPPWTDTSTSVPSGTEADLIEAFAEQYGAELEWSEGSESVIAEALHAGSIDVGIGGFTDATPWTDKAALTDAYAEARGPEGRMEKHVMLARPGENRLLVRLEAFLRENGARS